MTKNPSTATAGRARGEAGIVLPIALIMLVIISFAGLLSARNSASYEQFSNNMRTTQVARQSAEAALRHCERVAMDQTENEGVNFVADAAKIVSTKLTDPELDSAAWKTKANWVDGAANLITVSLEHSNDVKDAAKIKNDPSCIIQPLRDDQYLITARGLSNDAQLDNNGQLTAGSEVWLQSILKQGVPVKSSSGGNA
ncbi:pilus assembly PilX family protein [Hydrogenophaga sp. NFH-34]|uniref:pilus assembly PilX family protein n=1 Tax=Hydrogenophaga sp. NFH-34 TaxID=2744446 RepID=UPI001F3539C5|nr:hypothetical protein [Hydrogenophaga sp. NFH-34]